MLEGLPYRAGDGGCDAPEPRARPRGIALPAPGAIAPRGALPGWRGSRPLKRWRYVGVYGPRLMICAADVHIGPLRQTFWAIWDRERRRLLERTRLLRHGHVQLAPGVLRIRDGDVALELELDEQPGIEAISPHGRDGYVWTRKQGGVPARGELRAAGERHVLDARAIIDDTAGYHARVTRWRWAAGVGETADRVPLAFNLVAGVNDPPRDSERTLWVDGIARELGPVRFNDTLDRIESLAGGECELRFDAETQRARRERLLLVSSDYRQPFGTFTGALAPGVELARGYGVVEHHDVRW